MVIAKSLKQAFTCRDAEAESGQDLTKPIYTHPNIKCSRDNFAEKAAVQSSQNIGGITELNDPALVR